MHIIVSGKKREVADGLTVAQLLNSKKMTCRAMYLLGQREKF